MKLYIIHFIPVINEFLVTNSRLTILEKLSISVVVFIIILLVTWSLFYFIEGHEPSLSTIKDIVGILSTMFASTVAVLLFQNWRDQEKYKEIKDIKKVIVINYSILMEKRDRISEVVGNLEPSKMLLILPTLDTSELDILINYEKEIRVTVESSDFFKCKNFKDKYNEFYQTSTSYNHKVRWVYTVFYNYFNDKKLVQDLRFGRMGAHLESVNPISFDADDLERLPNLKNIDADSFDKLKIFMEDSQKDIISCYDQYRNAYTNYLQYLNDLQ